MKRFSTIIAVLGICCMASTVGYAAPVINSASGNFVQGDSITIAGSGFGLKSPAKPYLWSDFNGSVNPSSLGLITSWTSIDHMAYNSNEGVGGSGCLKASDSSGTWIAYINSSGFAWNDLNQKMYLFRKTKRNFDITTDLNWKVWRLWNANFTYPNVYIQTGNGNVAVEGISGSGGWLMEGSGNLDQARGIKNVYNIEEILTKSNSTINSTDGYFCFYVNGVDVGHIPYYDYAQKSFYLKTSSAQMVMNIVVHGVKANTTFPSDYRYWADDVYLDTTWARVMIGNSVTFSSSTHKEIQIPSAWAANSVAVTFNQGAFQAGQTVYLFVVDADGNVNQNGLPIVIGGGGGTPPPSIDVPTGLRIQ